MAIIEATVTLALFLAGAVTGVIMRACLAIRREDRLAGLGRQAASVRGTPSAVRMLVSIRQRALPEGNAVTLLAMR
jgi:hypothetical protein